MSELVEIKKLKQASMDYTLVCLKYCDAFRELILSNKILEISFSDIMNSPFYLTEKTIETTIERLNTFTNSFGYSCFLKKDNNKKIILFNRIEKET